MKKILAVLAVVAISIGLAFASSTVTEHSFSIPNGGGIEKIDGVHLTNVTWNGTTYTVSAQTVVTNVTKQTVSLTDTNGVTAAVVTNITMQTKSVIVLQ
jgi:hypothetical protein